MINERTGIIREVHKFMAERGDPPLKIWGGEVSKPVYLGGNGKVESVGGAGVSDNIAQQALIGEALERYCAAFEQDIYTGTVNDFPNTVFSWSGYHERQFGENNPFHPLTSDTIIGWTSMLKLGEYSKHLVPASLVYLPYQNKSNEVSIFPSLSSGLAAHRSSELAISNALLELIERDAFTLAWLANQPLPVIDPDIITPICTENSICIPDHWVVRVSDITSNIGVPTYLTSITARTSIGDIFAVGASAKFNAIDAILKSIIEAIQSVPYIRHLLKIEPGWRPAGDFSNIVSFKDHCRFYSLQPDHKLALQHIHPENISLEANDPYEKLQIFSTSNILTILTDLDIDIYAKRLTTIDAITHGYEVVRLLSPQLMPLHGHFLLPHLTNGRLWDLENVFPFKINNLKSIDDINPWPHPFA